MTIRKANGFALIDVIFVCGIMGLLTSIAIPRLLGAKQSASASSAIGSLRAITSAQLTYALTCGSGFYAPDLVTLGTAPPGTTEPFIGGGLGLQNVVVRSSYRFVLEGTPYPGSPPTCNGLGVGQGAQGYKVSADPTEPTNPRFFGTNSQAQIYEDSTAMLDHLTEVGDPPTGTILR